MQSVLHRLNEESMKKLSLKLRKKAVEQPSSRITNETVAEHRERILAGGRRFKYPMQYARHRLVFNTIIISLVALILIVGLIWQQLYVAQNTGTFLYRVTKALPLPVASVDNEPVRYSDYLMQYRFNIHYLEQKDKLNTSSEDGKRQVVYHKNQAMDKAVEYAYASKLARENNISLTKDQINSLLEKQRHVGDVVVSKEAYDAVILDHYDWTPDEYEHELTNQLLLQEVTYKIDQTANKKKDAVAQAVKDPEADFDKIAEAQGGKGVEKVTVGTSGLVLKNNRDGGLSEVAAKLTKGQVSGPIKPTAGLGKPLAGDGFYFIKLLDSNDTQLNYSFIRIPVTEFANKLKMVREQGKVHNYITLPIVDGETAQPTTSN
ncbi:hypothetical protein D3C73_21360 [compost metagenome]